MLLAVNQSVEAVRGFSGGDSAAAADDAFQGAGLPGPGGDADREGMGKPPAACRNGDPQRATTEFEDGSISTAAASRPAVAVVPV